jgi:hypothetical protein
MLQIALAIPIVLFLILGRATRSGWRLEVSLLFMSPLIATLLLLAGEAAVFRDVGPIVSVRDLGALVASFCLFILPEGIYPSGACIAALVLLAWFALEKFWSLRPDSQMRRILMASAMGAAIGLLFAILILLAYTSPQFVEFMQHRDRPPPLVLPMSLLTGAIDGVLVAYLWNRNDSTNTYASPAQNL